MQEPIGIELGNPRKQIHDGKLKLNQAYIACWNFCGRISESESHIQGMQSVSRHKNEQESNKADEIIMVEVIGGIDQFDVRK